MVNVVQKIATKYNVPVADSNLSVTEIQSTLGIYLLNHFSPSKNVHASLAIVNNVGVLIVGKSGVGKSEALLELIQNNHTFVSDDTVIIKKLGRSLFGYPSDLTKNFLESRGIGLIDVPYIYGVKAIKDSTEIQFVVELTETKEAYTFDRLGDDEDFYEALGSSIPKVFLPVKSGRTISSLIEAAVNVFLAKKEGLDPLSVISKRSKELR
jgi:HPr kinase/phosphorylase